MQPEDRDLPREEAYLLSDKPVCPKHPSKTIQYFCTQEVCSDRLSCSSCILKKNFCRHDMAGIVDVSQFLYRQQKAMDMKGLSSDPQIFDYLVHRQDRITLYSESLKDEVQRFKAQLNQVSNKVSRVFRELQNQIESQFQDYVTSYKSMENMLMKKINDSFLDTFLSKHKSFDELVSVSATGTLQGLKSLLEKLKFQTIDQSKLKQIRKTYLSIVSMQEQTPMVDYQKYQHIKSHFKLFQSKLAQAGPTLITLKLKNQIPQEKINPLAIFDKVPSIPISNIRKMAESSHFPTGHARTVFGIIKVKDRIFTCSDDGSLKIFDGVTYQLVSSLACHSSGIRAITQLPNNQIATASYDKTIKIWNIQQYLGSAINNSSLTVSTSKNGPVRTLSGHTSSVIALQYLNDGVSLASGSADYSIKIWNIHNGTSKNFTGHMNDVLAFACTLDGQFLISGSADRTIKTWSLTRKYSNTCLKTLTGHTDAVWSIVLLPDMTTLFSGSLDKSIKMWNIKLGTLLKSTVNAHSSHITKVINLSQGIIASSSQDGTIKIWDYRAGIEVHCLQAKKSGVTTMMVSQGGGLISVNQEKEAQVWD